MDDFLFAVFAVIIHLRPFFLLSYTVIIKKEVSHKTDFTAENLLFLKLKPAGSPRTALHSISKQGLSCSDPDGIRQKAAARMGSCFFHVVLALACPRDVKHRGGAEASAPGGRRSEAKQHEDRELKAGAPAPTRSDHVRGVPGR